MPKIMMDLPEEPEGYEYTGEYRQTKLGEPFMNCQDELEIEDDEHCLSKYPILKKKHNPTELVYCLQHSVMDEYSPWLATKPKEDTKAAEWIGNGAYQARPGAPFYSLILDNKGQLWLGLWNDGPKRQEG